MIEKRRKQTAITKKKISIANKIFTEKKELQICKEYVSKEKPSCMTLAKKHGCSEGAVKNIIRRNGFVLRTRSEALKGEKNFNYGKDHSGKNGPFYGHHFSESFKRKRRKFTKEGEQNIHKGYLYEKLSIATLAEKCGCGQTTIEHIITRNGGILRTPSDAALIRVQTQHGPYKDTKPELKMEEILNFLHIPYEKQYRVSNHVVDFRLLNTNRLIEVDGDYWHGNPKKFSKLDKTQKENKQRDIKNNQIAREKGFVVLRFWEDDILNHKEIVIEKIKKELKKA